MIGFKKKKDQLYLSDRPPLSVIDTFIVIIMHIALIFWIFVVMWPVMMMLTASFNGNLNNYVTVTFDAEEYAFSFSHFKYLFTETLYLTWLKNTLTISILTTVIMLILVSFTGFAFSRFRFKGRKKSLMIVMLIQTIPGFAGLTAYFTLYEVINSVLPFFTQHMLMIGIYTTGGIATNTFILKGYLDSISTELDDAGKIDGCSNMQIYRLIIMPIARPILAIIALWAFVAPFMDYLLPKVLLSKPESLTLAAGIFTFLSNPNEINQPAFVAGALIVAVPIVFLFIYLQKHLIAGLAKGSVKG